MVAQERSLPDEAEEWYRKSLAITEELGDRASAAITHAQLGRLAAEYGETRRALIEAVRCVCLFDQIPHSSTGTGPTDLRRWTAEFGIEVLAEVWREVTGNPLPDNVRAYATPPESNEQDEQGDADA